MAITTYAELQDAIARWLNRTDLTAPIQDFIALCEADINRRLRVRDMVTDTTLASPYTLPDDFAEAVLVSYESSPEFIIEPATDTQAVSRFPVQTQDIPHVYAIQGSTLEIRPTPSQAINLKYYAKVPALSDAAPTNWLLTKHPNVYLYGSLIHGAAYVMDHQMVNQWGSWFKREMDSLTHEDRKGRITRARKIGNTP